MSSQPASSRPSAAPAHWPDLAGRLVAQGHVLPIRIYYEDTDAGGVVYHAAYLRFCERARSDWLRLLGVHHGDLHGDDGRRLHFVVRRMQCDFLAPARLDDVLEVRSRLLRATQVRLEAMQEVHLITPSAHWSGRTPPQTGPIFTARVTVAVVDDSGRVARLPRNIVAGFDNHEGA